MMQIFFLWTLNKTIKTHKVIINKKYNPLKKYANAPKNGLLNNKKSPANKLLNSTKAKTRATKEAIARPRYTKIDLTSLIMPP